MSTLTAELSHCREERRQVPAEVIALLGQAPDATTYQFVFKAVPVADGLLKLQRPIRQLALENVGLREAAGRSDVKRPQLQDELGALRSEHGAAMREISSQRDEIRRLRVRLDRILASPPAMAHNALRRLSGVRRVAA